MFFEAFTAVLGGLAGFTIAFFGLLFIVVFVPLLALSIRQGFRERKEEGNKT